jgi:rod shape-determining protein MreC
MEPTRDDFVIAIRSAFLKKGLKQRFSILGLLLFSILFLFLGSLNLKIIDYVKITLKEIVYRSSFIVSGPENFLKKNYLIINSHFKIYDENKKNLSELEILKTKNLSKKILMLENIKYKKLIDDYFIKENETYAKVLIDKQSPFLRSIVINKGSKNNIKLGMIVLDEDYLVGKVVEVNFFSSRVLLISDINSKIPVSLEPGDFQAIMSGKENNKGILQYIEDPKLLKKVDNLLVITSGAGGVFKSGIPVGTIDKKEFSLDSPKIVNFYKDFSQLKYVKVISFSKEKETLDTSSKEALKKIDNQIVEKNNHKRTLKILKEQKKIEEEIRIKIEEENNILKDKFNKMANELLNVKKILQDDKIREEEIKFIELNILYEKKCKKKFIKNKLFKKGSKEYRACILNKGKI